MIENWVSVDQEIIPENWVTVDVCNPQHQGNNDWCMKSIAKIESWLTHGIVKKAMSLLIHKSSVKTESCCKTQGKIKVA
jgi:hypothetical protein